tara:strand:- start:197 stop:940 length:744 start_codon:yes stop_codon:yes gene_type:complete
MAEETGQPQETQEKVERPEYIPEKFWDTDRSEPNVEALGSSYKALESKLGQRTEELGKSIREDIEKETKSNIPTNGYELVTPDIPEGVEVNLDPELPLVGWWNEFAQKKGLSQDDFNDGVKAFVDNAVADIPNIDTEIQSLGDNGKQRVEAVDLWAKKNLSSDAYKSVSNIATSANNIKVLEEIMNLTKDSPMPNEDMAIDVAPSENDLRSMMRDPRYWDDARKDQGYIDRVTTLYEKKYGTEPAKL